MQDTFKGLGVKVSLVLPENFLKVKETLTRMGVASKLEQTLYQSCHILHKRGLYAIMHFKEMFILDGKGTSLSEEDIGRRNLISKLLGEWKLVNLLDPSEYSTPLTSLQNLKVLPFRDKATWTLVSKYQVGVKKIQLTTDQTL